MDSSLIPIRFYAQFATHDWPALPTEVQDALASFLLKLQRDPNNVEILANAERDQTGRLACEFSPGYAVFWRVGDEGLPHKWIEVLAILKNETTQEDSRRPPNTVTAEQQDSLEKVYSRTTRLDNLRMWGSLHVSRRTGRVAGWIIDSWSEWGAPYLRPKMHWVSYSDHKLYLMKLNIDFTSTMHLGPEDTDVEIERLIFVRATLPQWERDWIEQEAKKTS